MVMKQSRVQKNAKFAPEGKPSDFLIRAMNDELGGAARGNRKIVDPRALLLLVKRLQALEEVLVNEAVPLFQTGENEKIIDSPNIMRRYRAVNRVLRRYEAVPSIIPGVHIDPDSLLRGWRLIWKRTGTHAQPFFEIGLVLQIMEIASAGNIFSLKQCANCSKWLLGRFSHQRFCSQNCKDEFHKSNEADKKRRRDWARANYQARKRLEAGSIAGANLKRRKGK